MTGASGFIGSHVVANLLARGRIVRATVRDATDPERVDHLNAMIVGGEIEAGDVGNCVRRLEIIEMDLLDEESVLAAVSGCTDIIHCAAALDVNAKDPQRDVVDPSVIGCRNLCSAIERDGGVRRLVHTSSTAAIRKTVHEEGRVWTREDWCDDATVESNPYGLAKAEAERTVREWHSRIGEALRLRLVTIHPCVVLGPPLSKRHLVGSLSYIEALVKRSTPRCLPLHVSVVDVRDVAEAHVRALTGGEEEGRYLIVSGEMWMLEMAEVLAAAHPDRRWPRGVLPYWACLMLAVFHPKVTVRWMKRHLGKSCSYDASPSTEDLGMVYRSPEEAVIDSVQAMLENGWV